MSYYSTIRTRLTDKEIIVHAIKSMGFPVEKGSSLPVYDWCGSELSEKAEIVIQRKHLGIVSRDIAFLKTGDVYKIIISDMGVHSGKKKNFVMELAQKYSYLKVKKRSRTE